MGGFLDGVCFSRTLYLIYSKLSLIDYQTLTTNMVAYNLFSVLNTTAVNLTFFNSHSELHLVYSEILYT